jgi:predicted phosphodiesterase
MVPESKLALVWDMHLQLSNPVSRKDNYFEAGLLKFEHVLKHNTHIILLGDVFHRAVVLDECKNRLLSLLSLYNREVYVVPGNHDIQNDLLETLPKTSLGNLAHHSSVKILEGNKTYDINGIKVGVLPYSLAEARETKFESPVDIVVGHHFYEWSLSPQHSLLAEHVPQYNAKLLCLGHDHQPYADVVVGSTVIKRIGSLLRTALYQYTVDHRPCYLRILENLETVIEEVPFVPASDAFRLSERRELKKCVRLISDIKKFLSTADLTPADNKSMREVLLELEAPTEVIDYLQTIYRVNLQEF